MNLTSFTFRKFLSPDECNNIIETCLQKKLEEGKVFAKGEYKVLESARKSKVTFFPFKGKFDWLIERIKENLESVIVLKGYKLNYELDFQFTHYGVDEYYGWHKDTGNSGPASQRAYSLVIQLSDNYKGGLLQFKQEGIQTFGPGLGKMWVFPSSWDHQVTPVKEGTRYSLVAWFSIERIEGYTSTLL